MFEPLPTLANEAIGVIVPCYGPSYLTLTYEQGPQPVTLFHDNNG